MKPHILYISFIAFFAFLILHVMIWRIRRPKNDMGTLFLIFWVIPTLLFALYVLLSLTAMPQWALPLGESAAMFMLYFALASAYMQNYPPAQVPAPTLKIILLFESAKSRGLSLEELGRLVNDRELVTTALDDLVNANMIVDRDGKYVLGASANLLIRSLKIYRKLLGLTFKGG